MNWKVPVGKRQADFSMRQIQTLTRTCSVIAQVFFKFAIQRRFHHDNIFIIFSILPCQNEAWYNTEEKCKCVSEKYCGYITSIFNYWTTELVVTSFIQDTFRHLFELFC